MGKEINIYEVIRKAHNLKKYCEACGLNLVKIGTSYRANSPFTNGTNAFCINIDSPEKWHDFSLTENNDGDIIEFSALYKHNGDKKAALLELAPKGYSAEIDSYIKDRQSVQEIIINANNHLLHYENMKYLMTYYESRGVDLEQINRLMLGYIYQDFKYWLLIPRFDANGKEFRYYRLRRVPDEHGQENESQEKYKGAYLGDNKFMQNIPLGLQTLNRKSKYFVLVEGDFDYLNFEREGFAVLGTGGGNGINKEILRIIRDNAEKFVAVVLAYDNDDAGKKFTYNAAKLLFERRITFSVVELPENCKDINDAYRAGKSLQELCDDALPGLEYLAQNLVPSEAFETLSRGRQNALKKSIKSFFVECRRFGADNADIQTLCECLQKKGLPEKWLAEIKQKSEYGDSDFDISRKLQEQHNLMFNEKTGFYEYDTESESWQQVDDTTIGSYVYDYLGQTAKTAKINAVVELTKKAPDINSAIPLITLNRLPLVALKNGTIHFNFDDLSKSQFLAASPSDYVTNRREYEYINGAPCSEWLETLQIIFAGDERRIKCLQEFCGYAWLPDCRFHKALYLRGDGRNGKSTILNVLKKLYGDDNYSSLELTDLLKDFQRINLLYPLINISAEEGTSIIGAEAILKKVIAGDTITGCYKLKDFIKFTSRAKFIFACNNPLETRDKSFAMMSRFLLIDCPVRFVDEPDADNPLERKKIPNFEARLTTHESLAGIFIWSMRGLVRLIKQGKFTETAEQAELTGAFKANTDSIDKFVAECSSEWQGKKITRGEIYDAYCDYCDETGISDVVNNRKFFTAFNKILVQHKIMAKTDGQYHDGTRYYEFYNAE